MKSTLMICFIVLTLLAVNLAQATESFVMAIAPHASARVILEMYQPLRHYLEKALDTPVEIVTAKDFDTFARRSLSKEFDLAITSGHQAHQFQTNANYIPLLTYKADFRALLITANTSPIHNPADLKEKTVLSLSAASMTGLWGQHWMKENKLDSAKVKFVSASDSIAQLIVSGEVAAGFLSRINYQMLSPSVHSQLKVLAESKPLVGRVYLLNQSRAAQQKKIEAALWAFSETPEAKNYFEKYKLEGYRKLRPAELEAMHKTDDH